LEKSQWKELAKRPLTRHKAIGEALDPDKLEGSGATWFGRSAR
jgi:hypothetical protein